MKFHVNTNIDSNQAHYFLPSEAKKYGVSQALLIYELRQMLKQSRAAKTKVIDDYYWVYGTAEDLAEYFPYFSVSKIKRMIKQLEDKGVIISAFNSKDKFDRTKWYTMPEFKVSQGGV